MGLAISLDQVVPDVVRIRHLFVNAFLVGTSEGVVLVDAALPGCADAILDAVRTRFDNGRLAAVLLTHGHFDHVGALPELLRRTEATVFAHDKELPHLTGRADYPPADPLAGGGAMAWGSMLYPRRAIDLGDRVRALPADGTLPMLPGFKTVETPGHTAGHVSFFRERDRLLIAGDAVVTTKQESLLAVATQRPEVHGPPAYFTPDWDAARLSVQVLDALEPEIAATGHGPVLRGRVFRDGLAELARSFDAIARPAHGWTARQAR